MLQLVLFKKNNVAWVRYGDPATEIPLLVAFIHKLIRRHGNSLRGSLLSQSMIQLPGFKYATFGAAKLSHLLALPEFASEVTSLQSCLRSLITDSLVYDLKPSWHWR